MMTEALDRIFEAEQLARAILQWFWIAAGAGLLGGGALGYWMGRKAAPKA